MRIQNLSKTSDKTEYRHFVFLIFEAYLLKRIAYCEKIAVCPQQSETNSTQTTSVEASGRYGGLGKDTKPGSKFGMRINLEPKILFLFGFKI